jgi:hypothetical protein
LKKELEQSVIREFQPLYFWFDQMTFTTINCKFDKQYKEQAESIRRVKMFTEFSKYLLKKQVSLFSLRQVFMIASFNKLKENTQLFSQFIGIYTSSMLESLDEEKLE